MASRKDFNQKVRRTTIITLGLTGCLIFGIVVLVTGDWIPGGIIVAATLIGLAKQIPVIRQLCSAEVPPSAPEGTPVG